jgi:hypothetical protein
MVLGRDVRERERESTKWRNCLIGTRGGQIFASRSHFLPTIKRTLSFVVIIIT